MRRWFTMLLIVCLTFDFSLAANCLMCRDTDGAIYGLSGPVAYRADEPAKSSISVVQKSRTSIDDDCDCRHCQLDCAVTACTELPVLANGPLPGVVPSEPVFHESILVVRLERPKWFPVA